MSHSLAPRLGLFLSLVAASLPRFIATCPARPGLTVGCTLDRGPDRAEVAIIGGERLGAREVNGGVVIALVAGPALGASPVLVPSDLLHVPAGEAGLGGWVPAVRYDQAEAVPAGLAGQLAAGSRRGRNRPGRAGRPARSAGPTAAASRPHPGRPRSPRGFSEPGGQAVEVVAADAGDPALQPGDLLLGLASGRRAACAPQRVSRSSRTRPPPPRGRPARPRPQSRRRAGLPDGPGLPSGRARTTVGLNTQLCAAVYIHHSGICFDTVNEERP